MRSRFSRSGLSLIALTILACSGSMIRIYYGSGFGFKMTVKESPSFIDTFVDIDDLVGMPRIAAFSMHPAAMTQLVRLGYVEPYPYIGSTQ